MAVYTYLGERYDHTHENQAFDQLCQLAEEIWGNKSESYFLVGNVTCNGHELDALLIKPDAIAVIDFKNFGGEVIFAENGPWYADGIEVKGGSKTNPYKQIHGNKFALLGWIKSRLPAIESEHNLGHISGLVLFQQEIYFDRSQVPPKIASWFNVGDFDSGLTWLRQLASPAINLNHKEQESIVEALGVQPYSLPGRISSTSLTVTPDEGDSVSAYALTSSQKKAVEKLEMILKSSTDNCHALIVTGMTSTGKSKLIRCFNILINKNNRAPIYLTNNATQAQRLKDETGLDFNSFYSHVFDLGHELESEDDSVPYHPIKQCQDAPSAVYVFDAAQMLSDEYFVLENIRFGSGYLFGDFYKFINEEKNSSAIFIMLGDPYQLQSNLSFISPAIFTKKNIPVHCIELTDIVGDIGSNPNLKAAYDLAQSINDRRFNSLDLETQGESFVVSGNNADERKEFYRQIFYEPYRDGLFITYQNDKAAEVTRRGRRAFLNRKSLLPEPGDILELRSKITTCSSSIELEEQTFYPGAVLTATKNTSEVEVKSILLKGRSQETVIRFRKLKCVGCGHVDKGEFELLFLEDYLLAEKPELEQDVLIALKAIANQHIGQIPEYQEALSHYEKCKKKYSEYKSDENKQLLADARRRRDELKNRLIKANPYYNAARLRYGYAATCHHARGYKWDYVVVDTSYAGKGRDNEEYFRWLYTAITRARHTVVLDKFVPITPWDKARVKSDRAQVRPSIKRLFQLPYPKDAVPSQELWALNWPEGLSEDKPELLALFDFCRSHLNAKGIVIRTVKQHKFQEQYLVNDSEGAEAVISLSYNGKYDVTNIRMHSGDSALGAKAISALMLPPVFAQPQAQEIWSLAAQACAAAGLQIEGTQERDWLLMLTLANQQQELAAIKMHFNKQSNPTTIEIDEITGMAILTQIQSAFGAPLEAEDVS